MEDPLGYYAILGIDRRADPQDIKNAFRKLVKAYHPDHNSDPAAELRFKKITEAYETLNDSARRTAYDGNIEKDDSRQSPMKAAPIRHGQVRRGMGIARILLLVCVALFVGAIGVAFWAWQEGFINLDAIFSRPAASHAVEPSAIQTEFPPQVYLQLASEPTRAAAEAAASSAEKKYGDLFGDVRLTIVAADLGQNDMRFRVQLRTATTSDASRICRAITTAGGDCFVGSD